MDNNTQSRYDSLAKVIIKHALMVSSGINEKIPLTNENEITMLEWLAVETVVENQNEYCSMIELSKKMGCPPSSFSRMIDHLQKVGLVEKYRIQGNKKNIVLRPSEFALTMYAQRSTELRGEIWREFFEELDGFSDEDIRTLTSAFNKLNKNLPSAHYSQDIELIRVE